MVGIGWTWDTTGTDGVYTVAVMLYGTSLSTAGTGPIRLPIRVKTNGPAPRRRGDCGPWVELRPWHHDATLHSRQS